MTKSKNVALLLIGVRDLSGGGGAERFFADFFDEYYKSPEKEHKLFFFSDKQTVKSLRAIAKLSSTKNLIFLYNLNNRIKRIIENIEFLFKIFYCKVNILHVPLYTNFYYEKLDALKYLPKSIRPKLVINIVDCEIPYSYFSQNNANSSKNYRLRYEPLFENIHIDGIYTWYKLFKKFAEENQLIKSKPKIEVAETRFSRTLNLFPAENKRNEVVFAARFDNQKNPLFFVNAVAILKSRIPNEITGWSFLMFGKGPLEQIVMKEIEEKELLDIVTKGTEGDMSKILPFSKCFVSTQNFENFPSLAINEAMTAGNAIIARNVGQTDYFVKHGINGLLLEEDTPKGLADMLQYFIEHPELHEKMGKESIALTKNVHTPSNFIKAIDKFWSSL